MDDENDGGGLRPLGELVKLRTRAVLPPALPPSPASQSDDEAAKETRASRGDFFAVDRRALLHVCNFGLNAAVSYLVIAAGTGGDQRTSFWSAHAIEKYTGIARGRAASSIKLLLANGVARLHESSTPKHPGYVLTPAHEIPPLPIADYAGEAVYDALPKDGRAIYVNEPKRAHADRLVRLGWATMDDDGKYRRVSYDAAAASKPQWIWLPKELVIGAADETPPVERVRQCNDVRILRLLIEIYGEANLLDNGGVHWRRIRRMFTREKIGERGEYVIFGFGEGTEECFYNAPFLRGFLTGKKKAGKDGQIRDTGWDDFWEAWETLKRLGLVQMVGHLIEADTGEAEVLHPLPVPGDGAESVERDIAHVARAAAAAMLTWTERQSVEDMGPAALVSVLRHQHKAQLVGIARLRYRPRTRETAQWYGRLQEQGEAWIAEHRKRGEAAGGVIPASRNDRSA
jgi:hypothetical protein